MSTLVIMCADARLFGRTQELHDLYSEKDGHPPYFVRLAGASLPLLDPKILSVSIRDLVQTGVRHFHMENHVGMGDTSGCAAFRLMASREKLDLAAELPRHLTILDGVALNLKKFVRQSTGEAATVTGGIYRHTDSGHGLFEPTL